MQLPFQIEFEPPTLADLKRLVGLWWVWFLVAVLLAGAAAAALVLRPRLEAEASAAAGFVQIESQPQGATVEADGRKRGVTPFRLSLPAGNYHVTLTQDGYLDTAIPVTVTRAQTATLSAALWRRTPQVQRLRPTFPGASITDAEFLADGRVALALTFPPGDERHLWLADGRGNLQRVGPPSAPGALAVSSDGATVAYLSRAEGARLGQDRLDQVRFTRGTNGGDVHYSLPSTGNETLLDLSFTQDGRRVLLVSRETGSSMAARTHLRRLDVASGEVAELVTLPSEIVPGSYAWAPAADWVALMTRTNQTTSLCLLNVATAEFRYLADLAADASHPLPFAPLAWSPDGKQALYVALAPDLSTQWSWLLGARAVETLFKLDIPSGGVQTLGDASGVWPTWNEQGQPIALARTKTNSPLSLRPLDITTKDSDFAPLPLTPGGQFAVRWDIPHAQAIVASRNTANLSGDSVDYWLVRWWPEEGR
ncbi:MAG: PEGA domain-containing protein [Anaerolineae bacterium]